MDTALAGGGAAVSGSVVDVRGTDAAFPCNVSEADCLWSACNGMYVSDSDGFVGCLCVITGCIAACAKVNLLVSSIL